MYDVENQLLKDFEKNVTAKVGANERFKISCEVTSDIYSKVDHISATFNGKSHEKPNMSSSNVPTINRPIESITLDVGSKAVEIGDSLFITAKVTPTNTDDYVVWSSTDENVLTVKSGVVKAVGVGTAGILAKAENGRIEKGISIKVMPKSNGAKDITSCNSLANSAILTITNKCYNTFLGIPTKSETKTFKATIFKQSSTTYYFISGYANFKIIEGYDYQEWTATDYTGKKYEINSIQHENDTIPLGNNFAMAIGSINGYNLGVLPFTSRGYYYKDERLFISSGSTFIQTSMNETVATSSPITAKVSYQESLFGSPVLDSSFNLVGFVIRKDSLTGYTDFAATWAIEKFVKSCGITI